MRFVLCEKQFLYLNANADPYANDEMLMMRFCNGQKNC